MNAADVDRFQRLKYERDRSPDGLNPETEAEYQVLLERVIPGRDGLSEFPTETTEIVRQQQREVLAKQVCADVANGLIAGVRAAAEAVGPELIAAVVAGLTKR